VFSVAGRPEWLFARGGFANFGEIAVKRTALTVRILDEQDQALVTRTIKAED
jgi:hypothetical protein